MRSVKIYKNGALAGMGVQYTDGLIVCRWLTQDVEYERQTESVRIPVHRRLPETVIVQQPVEIATRDASGQRQVRQGTQQRATRQMVTREVGSRVEQRSHLVPRRVLKYSTVAQYSGKPALEAAGYTITGGY